MAKFNGYPSWTQWNVSLWINNDEGLYSLAEEFAKSKVMPKKEMAQAMLNYLLDLGLTKTPDGAKYSVTALQRAMIDM